MVMHMYYAEKNACWHIIQKEIQQNSMVCQENLQNGVLFKHMKIVQLLAIASTVCVDSSLSYGELR